MRDFPIFEILSPQWKLLSTPHTHLLQSPHSALTMAEHTNALIEGIPKLKGDSNYSVWAQNLRSAIQAENREMWAIIISNTLHRSI